MNNTSLIFIQNTKNGYIFAKYEFPTCPDDKFFKLCVNIVTSNKAHLIHKKDAEKKHLNWSI